MKLDGQRLFQDFTLGVSMMECSNVVVEELRDLEQGAPTIAGLCRGCAHHPWRPQASCGRGLVGCSKDTPLEDWVDLAQNAIVFLLKFGAC